MGTRSSNNTSDDDSNLSNQKSRRKRGPMPCFKFQPFRSLLCEHHIRGRSNSLAHQPTPFPVQYHLLALPPLRRRSTRKSGTSRFSCSSQLTFPVHRMQRLYRDVCHELVICV